MNQSPVLRTALLLFVAHFSALGAGFASAAEDAKFLLRISTENTLEHVQTQAIERFSQQLEHLSEGRIDVQFSHSAQLFRDRDVVAALSSGKVEMAVPGMWQLDRYVPDVGLYMLPLFYGRSAEENYRVRDGEIGAMVSKRIANDLGVRVPGRWMDLGYAHLYFTDSRVSQHEDLSGLKLRIPGGIANRARLESFSANPVVVAWPDLPDALEHQQVDGVLTTHETVRSAELWKNRIQYSFEDREYFAQYVPMINARFWDALPTDLQQLIQQAWEQVVDDQRKAAEQAQEYAREALINNGIEILAPDIDALEHWRRVARKQEPSIIQQMGVDPELVLRAEDVLEP